MHTFFQPLTVRRAITLIAIFLLAATASFMINSYRKQSEVSNATGTSETAMAADSGERETITLAGGCFWCIEAFFQEAPGVVDAISGYAGGKAETATYEQVSTGKTGHREAVEVTFDPKRISLTEVLNIYWSHIDPTDAKGQFADKGSQYTTVIYYHTEEQKTAAEASKQALADNGLFTEPIVTEILPFTTFFVAEDYHQDYYKKSAAHYELYKMASGRSGFIEENWAKEAALEFLEADKTEAEPAKQKPASAAQYKARTYSAAEIETGLKKLSAEAYRVVAEEGTEPPFRNAYWDNHEEGIYVDVVTGRPLFSSVQKYDSGTGWPSFYEPLPEASLTLKTDTFLGFERTEVRSEAGHLGHVFNDGPKEHGGQRYCMNSLALRFVPKTEMAAQGYAVYLDLF